MNNEINYVSPFKKFCVTIGNLPTAYIESMSYYEGLTYLVNYLSNNVIPALNHNGEVVEELQNQFTILKNFVDTYFENLDVQEEVNTKLDEMAESGQLTDIIAQYLGLAGLLTFNTVDDLKVAENLANGSICKTLGYHQINDGGAAEYKIRVIVNTDVIDDKKIIAIADPSLVAELMVNDVINVKQIGAYGDDTNDDTSTLQYAINNYDNVYIPKGTYKVTDQINIKSNLHLFGDGATSIIKSYFEYVDEINYILLSDSSNDSITRTIIEKLQFVNDDVNTISGGIYVEFSTRGLILQDLWFNNISNCIKLGDKIWAMTCLTNIYGLFLPTALDAGIADLAYGIYAEGNTTYGKNIELLGKYKYGIYLYTCGVGSWKDINVSGSTSSYQMTNGIKIENSKEIEINTGWFEEIDDGDTSQTKTIEILNSDQITLSNLRLSDGSVFVDGSKNIKLTNVKYYQTNAGLRYKNNSLIECDNVSLGYCNYQGKRSTLMGTVNVTNVPNRCNENLYNNPIFLAGIYETITNSTSGATKSTNTTDMLTGDRCFNFNTVSYQGGKVTTTNTMEIGKYYTVLAYVRINSNNVKDIYMTGSNLSYDTTYPSCFYTNLDNNTDYHLIKTTVRPTDTPSSISIIATSSDNNNCDFIIDSVFIVEGKHDFTIPSALNKKGIVRNSRLTAETAPYAGTWNKGDIVYNNFSNANYDNVSCWIYNGSSWIAQTLP